MKIRGNDAKAIFNDTDAVEVKREFLDDNETLVVTKQIGETTCKHVMYSKSALGVISRNWMKTKGALHGDMEAGFYFCDLRASVK